MRAEAAARGLAKHGQILAWLKTEHGMSHGSANRVAIEALKPAEAPTGAAQIDAIYAGRNAGLRPLHDRVIDIVSAFGPDVELAPKKSYASEAVRHGQSRVGRPPEDLPEPAGCSDCGPLAARWRHAARSLLIGADADGDSTTS